MTFITKIICCYLFLAHFNCVISKPEFVAKITTWNVNEKPPLQHSSMSKLLTVTENPDFYAVTLQEVNPYANPLSCHDEKWVKAIKLVMTSKKYDLLAWESIDGSLTAVFAKQGLKPQIKNIDPSSERTGCIGIYGNKGGSAVSFQYKGKSIVFVGAHFHAGDDQIQARLDDYNEINNKARFTKGKAKNILDHDIVFWSGDLNFRLNDLSAEQINNNVKSKSPKTVFTSLMAYDQLKSEMKDGKIFQGYQEGKPEFNPTYKYKIGTNTYDLKRKPAYTDRILYRVKSGKGRVLSYRADTSFMISDHKPVTAVISIE